MKKLINISIVDDVPTKVIDLIPYLQDALDKTKEEYKDSLDLDVDHSGYGGENIELTVDRLETDEEYSKRKRNDEDLTKKELAILERLKAKYETT